MFMSGLYKSRGGFAWAIIIALLVFAPGSAGSQENPRFYGVWEPASTTAGGYPLALSRGRITFADDGEISQEDHFEIIKDFGDRLVVKLWTVKSPFEDYPLGGPMLEIFEITLHEIAGARHWDLSIEFCSSPPAEAHIFETGDPADTWRRILEWSARRDEGFPYDHCNVTPEGRPFGGTWGGMGFDRDLRASD